MSASSHLDTLILLRDFKEGDEGKVWLACDTKGHLVVIKFPKGNRKLIDSVSERIVRECNMWNRLYGKGSAKLVNLVGRDALVMPVVFCCWSAHENGIGRCFNATLQPGEDIDMDMLEADYRGVDQLRRANELIKDYQPDDVAVQAINRFATNQLIHRDIAWRHIGLRPLFNKSCIKGFEPVLIDLSYVQEAFDVNAKAESLVETMLDLLVNQ